MNTENSIIQLVDQHKILLNAIVSKNLYESWINIKSSYERSVQINLSDILNFQKETFIYLPEEIIYFYTTIGCKEHNDFVHTINSQIKDQSKPLIITHFSKEFAFLICDTYSKLSENEKLEVENDILHLGKLTSLKNYPCVLNFLLLEGTDLYCYLDNKFSISFLEKIFRSNFSEELLIHSLVLWCHCGGMGSLVLNTLKKGYESGEFFGTFLSIEYNNKEYEYHSNYFISKEQHLLEHYRDKIIFEIRDMKNLLDK